MIDSSQFHGITVRVFAAGAWVRWALLLVFGTVLFGLCWWLFLLDLQRSLSAQTSAVQAEQLQRTERLAKVQENAGRAGDEPTQRSFLAGLEDTYLASGPGVWLAVHQASRKHDLRMEHFKPGVTGSEKPYPEQRAALRLSGDFGALLAFTRTLAGSSSRIAIESFSLGVRQTGPGLVLEATLLSLHRPPTGVPAALPTVKATSPPPSFSTVGLPGSAGLAAPLPGAATNPFDGQRLAVLLAPVPVAAAPANALRNTPLSSMRMVGSVRTAEQWAAVVLINGSLHAVHVGDALGNARGHVAEIRADGLTVREPAVPGTPQGARVVPLPLGKN